MPHPPLLRAVLASVVIALGLAFASAAPASAATYTVTPAFSLAQAIAAANANPGHDTITFDPTVTSVGGALTYTITDTVTIDACRVVDSDPATFDYGLAVQNGDPQFIVDAPDVLMQGFDFGGATTAIEVTPNGDRFQVRGSLFALNSAAAVHVTGAEDVLIGGVAPAPCSGQTGPSIILAQQTAGVLLDDVEGAVVDGVSSNITLGPSLLVTGGRGITLQNSRLQEAVAGGNDNIVDVSASGTADAPFRIIDSQVGNCLGDCVRIRDRTVFDIGGSDPAAPMTIRRVYDGHGGALVHISESTGRLHDTFLPWGDVAGVLIDDGSFDVTVERTEISTTIDGPGIRVDGPDAPTGIILRSNMIGYRFHDDGGHDKPYSFRNRGTGVEVLAGNGVLIGGDDPGDANLIASNLVNEVSVSGALNVRVIGNRIGTDPTTEAVPAFASNTYHSVVGVLVDGAPGVEVRGNTIGAATLHGVRVAGFSAGTVIAGNRIGTDAAGTAATAPNGGSGVSVAAADITVRDNTIGGSAVAAIALDAGATRVTVAGNRIGAQPDGTPNAGLANPTGVAIAGDGNLIGSLAGVAADANIISMTTGTDAAIVVSGQRNTIRGNSLLLNAGDGITLVGSANAGVVPAGLDQANATGAVLAISGAVGPGSPGAGPPWTIDVYASLTCGQGDREGQFHLGAVTTSSSTFAGNVVAPPAGYEQLTVTTTDAEGNTSQFGGCTQVIRLQEPEPTTLPPATTQSPDTTAGTTGPVATDPAGPGTTTTGPAPSPLPPTSPGSMPPGASLPGPGDPGTLPATGSSSLPIIALGSGLTALGVMLVQLIKRRS